MQLHSLSLPRFHMVVNLTNLYTSFTTSFTTIPNCIELRITLSSNSILILSINLIEII